MKKFTERAKWIGLNENDFQVDIISPAYQLRKTINLDSLPKSAYCLISGVGCYTFFVNGKRVGDDVLSPAFTVYDKRTLYLEYDLLDYLKSGENVISVKLGDGFFNQTTKDVWNFYTATWRTTPRLIFELFIDGKSHTVSDKSWKITTNGATVHNSIRTGEYYDARKADGWREVGYCDSAWQNAKVVHPVGGILCPQTLPPIRECETLSAVSLTKSKNGWIYDFGKNTAGYARIKMEGECGKTLVIKYAEVLENGELMTDNISYLLKTGEFATDKYTFSGEGVEEWNPEFAYHGFRYVELSGDAITDKKPSIDAVSAIFVHTDLKRKGYFSCSNELLNKIYEMGIRSFLSNFHGFSEDCPQREKNGWTGDAAISADYAVCTFDMKEAYKKWMADIVDSQRTNGQLPGIAPTSSWGYNWGSGPAWDIALFALPYTLYTETGDTECIDVVYDAAKKYLEYAKYYEDDGLVLFGLSDWCPPKKYGDLNLASNELSDSCYYYAALRIMNKFELLRGNEENANIYLQRALAVKEAIRRKYFNTGAIESAGQGHLAFLLQFRIVEGEEGKEFAWRLAELMKKDEYAPKVGILGMKALYNALSLYGYTDVAYRSATRREYPSYSYMIESGCTTLAEDWEANQSLNHHMYADVVNWMSRNVAGVKNCGIAYDKITITPFFFDESCSASFETHTPRGKVAVSWEKKENKLKISIIVPDDSDTKLILPGNEPISVASGEFLFSL